MRLTDKRRQELIERKDLVSIKGREYIALDALEIPVELAAPEPAAEPAQPARQMRSKDGGKADVEGTASPS